MRLSRNRDFLLFQSGQLLSAAGSSLSAIAYPLLVLALTGSPVKAGIVSFARLLPAPLLALPAGVASDRLDRRRIMLASDAVRALALAGLALMVWQSPAFWPIPLLAFVEGAGDTFFSACLGGVLRSVVPPAALPAAVSVQQGRVAVVGIVGPPAGGALFAVARALPFGLDALSYLFSFAAIAAMRTPFQQPRERRPLRIRADLAEGFRFLWTQPFLRATSFFYAIGNFTIPALLFVVLVVARRHGLTGGEIGILFALFSACILIGSLLGARGPATAESPRRRHARGVQRPAGGAVPDRAERLPAARSPAAAGVRPPDHRLVRDRPPAGGNAGPPARPGGGGARDDRPYGRAARLTHGGRSAQCDVGARRGRGVPRPDVWGGGVRDRRDRAAVAAAARGRQLRARRKTAA